MSRSFPGRLSGRTRVDRATPDEADEALGYRLGHHPRGSWGRLAETEITSSISLHRH
jgi:hypothetical protein